MITYFCVGAVIGLIVLLVALAHSEEKDRYIKAKQLGIWAAVFIIATAAWPGVLILCFLWIMGNA